MRFVSLDFETTGSVAGWPNEPWQLGLAVCEDDGTCTTWETFFRIDSTRPFSSRAPGRWAQLRDELAAAPTWDDVWPQVAHFLSGVPLVAHNAATERTLLVKRAPLAAFGPWVDTLRVVRRLWPILKSYALGDLIAVFGLKGEVDALCPGRIWHDALYDACAGAVLFKYVRRVAPSLADADFFDR